MEFVNQGKQYGGLDTFTLPKTSEPPAFIRGQDIEFVTQSKHSKFVQTRRPRPNIPVPRKCGKDLQEKFVMDGNVKSHQNGLKSGLSGKPIRPLGLCNDEFKHIGIPKDVSRNVPAEKFNETSLRWKYGKQEKNATLPVGVEGAQVMSRDIITGYARGASVSGYYSGLKKV